MEKLNSDKNEKKLDEIKKKLKSEKLEICPMEKMGKFKKNNNNTLKIKVSCKKLKWEKSSLSWPFPPNNVG